MDAKDAQLWRLEKEVQHLRDKINAMAEVLEDNENVIEALRHEVSSKDEVVSVLKETLEVNRRRAFSIAPLPSPTELELSKTDLRENKPLSTPVEQDCFREAVEVELSKEIGGFEFDSPSVRESNTAFDLLSKRTYEHDKKINKLAEASQKAAKAHSLAFREPCAELYKDEEYLLGDTLQEVLREVGATFEEISLDTMHLSSSIASLCFAVRDAGSGAKKDREAAKAAMSKVEGVYDKALERLNKPKQRTKSQFTALREEFWVAKEALEVQRLATFLSSREHAMRMRLDVCRRCSESYYQVLEHHRSAANTLDLYENSFEILSTILANTQKASVMQLQQEGSLLEANLRSSLVTEKVAFDEETSQTLAVLPNEDGGGVEWRGKKWEREGYLQKQSSGLIKTWSTHLYKIRDGVFWYVRDTGEESSKVQLELCNVKPYAKDLTCFEVRAPSMKKPQRLKAASKEEAAAWIESFECAIEHKLAGGGDVEILTHEEEILRGVAGNDVCCDCGSPAPEWASINLGCLICLECSGIHRSLGVHISKVQSLRLDTKSWTQEMLNGMCQIGNEALNGAYGASLASKPSATSSRAEKEAYIEAKYRDQGWWHRAGFIAPDESP